MCLFVLCKEKRREEDWLDLSSTVEMNINHIKMFAALHNRAQILIMLEIISFTLS